MDRKAKTGGGLLGQMRRALWLRRYSRRTVEAYVGWTRRFILFHGKRHPKELGKPEVTAFLSRLALDGVSASTQNQALAALLFLYAEVLEQRLPWLDELVYARRPERRPVVLTRGETARVLERIDGTTGLMAALLYGAGLRLSECATLRVKDLDLERREIVVRRGKGQKDRVTMLPGALVSRLAKHLERVKRQHEEDLAAGAGAVKLPDALDRKYPGAHVLNRGARGVLSPLDAIDRDR
jgi:integrase